MCRGGGCGGLRACVNPLEQCCTIVTSRDYFVFILLEQCTIVTSSDYTTYHSAKIYGQFLLLYM